MDPIFVYGTLCLPAVRDTLLRREGVPGTPARLDRAVVRRVRGRTYPSIVLGVDGTVEGLVLADIDAAERAILRAFEPPEYDLVPITVATASGPLDVRVFALRDAENETVDEPWSPAEFGGDALTRFLDDVDDAAAALWADQPFRLGHRTQVTDDH